MASLKNKSSSILKNAKILWLGIAVLLILVFVGTLSVLKGVYQTDTYYVLNQDVPAHTKITMNMLSPVVTSAGTAPGGSPDMTEEQKTSERDAILSAVQSGSAYSQFPLQSGDVLSPSNIGSLSDISVGIPDDWVVTSFSVDYNNAVQGRIKRGTYFDIMVVSDTGAYYPFVNVLALATSTGNATSSASDQDSSGMNAATSYYTVGMSPADAGKLQWLETYSGGNMKLVLSPRQNEYNSPDLLAYTGTFFYDPITDGVIAPGLQETTDSNGNKIKREVTDYTFTQVQRDQFGRPIATVNNVGLGNAKITSESAGDKSPTNDKSDSQKVIDDCKNNGGHIVDGKCSDAPEDTPSPQPSNTSNSNQNSSKNN